VSCEVVLVAPCVVAPVAQCVVALVVPCVAALAVHEAGLVDLCVAGEVPCAVEVVHHHHR
jgi:hypothetical protein